MSPYAMNANTIQKLKKELARNKAKSAVLAVLCLVAVYYWLPLFAKLLPGKKSKPAAVAATEAEIGGPPVTPTTNANSNSSPAPVPAATDLDWKKIARAIKSDVYMTSVPAKPEIRSPFAFIEEVIDEPLTTNDIPVDDPEDVPTEEEQAPDPTANLVVTSVIVGSRRSVATINGVSYKVGDVVRLEGEEFHIVTIDAESVSVNHGGKTVQVSLTKPWAAPNGGTHSFDE